MASRSLFSSRLALLQVGVSRCTHLRCDRVIIIAVCINIAATGCCRGVRRAALLIKQSWGLREATFPPRASRVGSLRAAISFFDGALLLPFRVVRRDLDRPVRY
eukprot:TRINITY_DN38359_c0_g1_i1.p1 TRINITY_DN38359_c0_g1~~TRINITY_DN38359_c0_g1_i1.p1  ORF type:complete len:104 (+),score=10.93 TRINITY_DN38359_c0_g1_i1:85-396(+)